MKKVKRQIRMVAVSDLKPYTRNARTHSEKQIAEIVASLNEFGWTNPILIDEEREIIAGHGRLEAAKRLGFVEVPCILLEGLTEEQKKALRIADNKLPLNAGWDEKLLAMEFADLKAADFDLDLLGFDAIEQMKLFSGGTGDGAGQTPLDQVPDPPKNPLSRPGDLWLMGKHRLLCGDSENETDVKRLLADQVPSLMVTDPPYGVEYNPTWRDGKGGFSDKRTKMRGKVKNDHKFDWTKAYQLFPGAVAYVWHASIHTVDVWKDLQACGFEHRAQIIWMKQQGLLSRGHYHWQHEPCWYCVRKGATAGWQGDRKQTTVWQIQNLNPTGNRQEERTGHGTQKPVECMRRPMTNHTSPGQLIYDPFLGSGTSIIAAESIGRICYGLDNDPVWCDVVVERYQKFTGKTATLEGDGRSFEEIKAARTDRPVSPVSQENLQAVS